MTRDARRLRREIDAALATTVTGAAPSSRGRSALRTVPAGVSLSPVFQKVWSSAVRTYVRHVSDLAAGDKDAFDLAARARARLYRLANSGEVDRDTASALYDFIEGKSEAALPTIRDAEETGRASRVASYAAEARRLRALERPGLDPRTIEGELAIMRARRG